MSEHLYIVTLGLPLATILIVFGMRYASAVLQARAQLANDGAYQRIAEQAAAGQAETAAATIAIKACLDALGARLAGVEKILKDVE